MTEHKQWKSVENLIQEVKTKLQGQDKLFLLFEKCYANTLHTTVRRHSDGTTFVITGDIPAMWLRDSAAQIGFCRFFSGSRITRKIPLTGLSEKMP